MELVRIGSCSEQFLTMSDSADDICGLPEVIETEQVVEILEESQFLDLAASMETRGEIMVANTSCFSSSHEEKESRQLIGHKRKRGSAHSWYQSNFLTIQLVTLAGGPLVCILIKNRFSFMELAIGLLFLSFGGGEQSYVYMKLALFPAWERG